MPRAQRFLVKMKPVRAGTALSLGTTGVPLRVEPLFTSIRADSAASGLGADQPATWHIVEPALALDTENPWDTAHAMLSDGLGAAGVAAEFVEPDFEQTWEWKPLQEKAFALTSPCVPADQKIGPDGYPGDTNKLWFRSDAYAEFDKALSRLDLQATQRRVRIAHLDTGYDPHHKSLPELLDRDHQRNFVDAERPNDASDDSGGLFNNRGHGTGTLSILAGAAAGELQRLGVAPFASVVPIRVANRVETFYNSAIARALDYVHALCQSSDTAIDVVTMSLGGLASQAWAECVNALYDAGVVVVTAAGNNFGNLPTHHIVYPARFNRVIAACGVMADHEPYANLPLKKMAGNYGPSQKMRTAIAAYTPNVPWAKFGCADVVDFDGAGTSAATPQVAGAAAIWLQKHGTVCENYPSKWMRVEAVRHALFGTASHMLQDRLGQGELRCAQALAVAPLPQEQLQREEPDSASFAFLRVLTGLGIEGMSHEQQRMLELEALQLSQSMAFENIVGDGPVAPEELTLAQRMAIARALAQHPSASRTLRNALQVPPAPRERPDQPLTSIQALQLKQALDPQPPQPPSRRLRVYAYDPSMARDLDTIAINETVAHVRWEPDLAPGPVGEYLEVVDVDPASGCCYAPVDLNDPRLLATDGLRASEGNPQFHQQMAYAVAMKTIELFEKALGRVALWSPRRAPGVAQRVAKGKDGLAPAVVPRDQFVQRLRIYPHAMRAQNAYYSPDRKALLLGYFSSRSGRAAGPNESIFTALSHDIVAHETSHALLDGLHRRFIEPTNQDVLAFHEAFADIVALFQHFTLRDSLRHQIAKSRGDLTNETVLAKLAVQFGRATGHYGGLRDAIGKEVTDKATGQAKWELAKPSPDDYQRHTDDPHLRGQVLVAAVFDAFLRIYARRAQALIRIATAGSEVLPAGALSTHLADALADVASKVAGHVVTMCIRALDYCPPIDITFGDYLRAIVTADRDLVPDDPLGYRVAFVSAFADRGIYPESVRHLSVDTVTWEPPPVPFPKLVEKVARMDFEWDLQARRAKAWEAAQQHARDFHCWLMDPQAISDDELQVLGLERRPRSGYQLVNAQGQVTVCDLHGIEVHSVRPLRRVGPDGQLLAQLVVELTQSLYPVGDSGQVFRGGATLLFDLTKKSVTYMVRKRIDHASRVSQQQGLWMARMQSEPDIYAGLTKLGSEPFAFLHRSHREAHT